MMPASSQPDLRGQLLHDYPLASLTSWKVGGPADEFYRPADLEDLGHYLAVSSDAQDITWLGLGSNLLVRDAGVRGRVIATHRALKEFNTLDANTIRVEAGMPCAKVARTAASMGLGGAEFLAGIPGTLGGALAMNAGAYGGETWQRVVRVETIDRTGKIQIRDAGEYRIDYRSVQPGQHIKTAEWFVAAHLRLAHTDKQESLSKITRLLDQRASSQPLGAASCGSVFRNPKDDFAARLIEACDLKGHCIGGACVSEKHANFIINTGNASASDIEQLIQHIQTVVRHRHGIVLQPEVRIIGEVSA